MAKLNENYRSLKESYLFSDIAKRVSEFTKNNPGKKVIRLGIGDVTLPLCPAVIDAMAGATKEMGTEAGFHGYGPEQGYSFLRQAVADYYVKNQVLLETDEIFISDGAKSDIGNITDLFSNDNTILVPDPVYPVYVDSNLMLGRKIIYSDANEENGFLPMPAGEKADIIYICSPNNPTGSVYNREQLTKWVEFALERQAVILFDAAYESFVSEPGLPRSIFEIPGARKCAIEFCSFSKTAGFTGTRCGYTIIPKDLEFVGMNVNKMWLRRQTTKFNGVPYVVQAAAAAVFTSEGQTQVKSAINYYRKNAEMIASTLNEKGIRFTGGVNSPYIWLKCPSSMGSWDFFDYLLQKAAVVGTPGAGFGVNGEGWFRLTAFGNVHNTQEACSRLKQLL